MTASLEEDMPTSSLPSLSPSRSSRWAAIVRRELADLRERGWILLAWGFALWCLHQGFGLSYAAHLSLPYPLWFNTKFAPATIERGDYVVVDLPPEVALLFPPGATFIKQVVGVPGDLVEAHGREYTVRHGQEAVKIGLAKPVSRKGMTLTAGPVGVIPHGQYFVRGTHPDSMDSRYAMMGWVPGRRIVGSVWPILPAATSRLWVTLGWSQE